MSVDLACALKELKRRLNDWDNCTAPGRQIILTEFLEDFKGEAIEDLEKRLAYGGSLLLARFIAWLQISYCGSYGIEDLLRAMSLFAIAPEGSRYVSEMIENGVLVSVLDVLQRPSCNRVEKAEALNLMTHMARKGRRYKEAICETFAIKIICESAAEMGMKPGKDDEELEDENYEIMYFFERARENLDELTVGNPDFQSQILQALAILLTSINSRAQLLTCKILRKLLPQNLDMAKHIIEPLLTVLGTKRLALLYEGLELMKIIKSSPHQEQMLQRLVQLSIPPKLESEDKAPLYITEPDLSELDVEIPIIYKAQADAIFLLGRLLDESILPKLQSFGIFPRLVLAMGTTLVPESQRRSALVLKSLAHMSLEIREELRDLLSPSVYNRLVIDPVETANTLSPVLAKKFRDWAREKLGEDIYAESEESDDETPAKSAPSRSVGIFEQSQVRKGSVLVRKGSGLFSEADEISLSEDEENEDQRGVAVVKEPDERSEETKSSEEEESQL